MRWFAPPPRDGPLAVGYPRGPMVEHGLARELDVLEAALIGAVAVDQLDDDHRRLPGELAEQLDFGVFGEVRRQVLEQPTQSRLPTGDPQLPRRIQPGAAGYSRLRPLA